MKYGLTKTLNKNEHESHKMGATKITSEPVA